MTRPVFLRNATSFAILVLGCTTLSAQQNAPATASAAQKNEAAAPAQEKSAPAPRFWTSTDPNAQVTILENTPFSVRTESPISTKKTPENTVLSFSLCEDIVVDGFLIVPRGATLHGTVVQNKPAGSLAGKPSLILKLTSLDLEGRTYPLYSYQFKVEGTSKSKETQTNAKAGAVIGGLAGDGYRRATRPESTSVGNVKFAATGAAAGAGTGIMVSAMSSNPTVDLPVEAQIDFALAAPISVVPVSREGAERLSHVIRRTEPVLYVRGQTP